MVGTPGLRLRGLAGRKAIVRGRALRYATRRKTPDYAGAWKYPVSDQPSTAYIQKPLDDVPIQEVEVQTLQEVIRENDKI